MFKQLSLMFIAVSAAGLKACSYAVADSLNDLMCGLWDVPQGQEPRRNLSNASEGTKAIALNIRHPPMAYSQAPSPANPRSLADKTDYCKYQYIPVRILSFPPVSKVYHHG